MAGRGVHFALTTDECRALVGTHAPANVILGGRFLCDGDECVLSLKTPEQVREIASFLRSVTEDVLRQGYDRIDADEYGEALGDEDFDSTWQWFQELRDFYERAARNGHHVLFTVDE